MTSGPGCKGLPTEWFFPTREAGADNHGTPAKAACAVCPVREACLLGAEARGEPAGIWGGAGEARRRVIRRARQDGPDRLAAVLAAHWRDLDGAPQPGDHALLVAHGDGAEHGRRSTYAKGCRCGPCSSAASFDAVAKSLRPRRRRAA